MRLETRRLSVAIRERQLVTHASIHVASGELVGLIGPNVAGKSTLLRAMLGIRERTSGDVLLDGEDFLSMPSRERARAVAFLPQERRVEWRLPGYDIVMLGRYPHQAGFGGPTQQDRAAVDRALDAVDGRGIIDRPVSVLSGGERPCSWSTNRSRRSIPIISCMSWRSCASGRAKASACWPSSTILRWQHASWTG